MNFSGNDHAVEGVFDQPTALQTLSLIRGINQNLFFSIFFTIALHS